MASLKGPEDILKRPQWETTAQDLRPTSRTREERNQGEMGPWLDKGRKCLFRPFSYLASLLV